MSIQPDLLLRMPSTTVLVEAKRIRPGSFQAEQLAREYPVLERDFASPTKVLLLVLPAPPPVAVRGRGRLSVRDAILQELEAVHTRAGDPPPLDDLIARLESHCAWLMWGELDRLLQEGLDELSALPPNVAAAIGRGVAAARRAIAWHS